MNDYWNDIMYLKIKMLCYVLYAIILFSIYYTTELNTTLAGILVIQFSISPS